LYAAVVWRGGAADEKALRAHCQGSLPAAFRPAHFITVAAIPRNDAGKIDRRRLPEAARS
jgi:acyl-CoA synthetase (AMP-forming)/AMP-acid ligase II